MFNITHNFKTIPMILPIFPVILTKNPIFSCENDAKMMQWFFGLPTSFADEHQFVKNDVIQH